LFLPLLVAMRLLQPALEHSVLMVDASVGPQV